MLKKYYIINLKIHRSNTKSLIYVAPPLLLAKSYLLSLNFIFISLILFLILKYRTIPIKI